jgi:hypothetical protein
MKLMTPVASSIVFLRIGDCQGEIDFVTSDSGQKIDLLSILVYFVELG